MMLGGVNVSRAMELADSYYTSLECAFFAFSPPPLDSNDDDKRKEPSIYLLWLEEPTCLDALLFAHIAEALTDVHLVLVLSAHPILTQYFG